MPQIILPGILFQSNMIKRGTHRYVADARNKQIMIYINGKIVPRKDASISVFDSGFLLGDGVWEGIRLYNGNFCFIEEHIQRLFYGAKQLKIHIGKSKKELIALLYKTIEANQMNSDIHVRLIISRGIKVTPY